MKRHEVLVGWKSWKFWLLPTYLLPGYQATDRVFIHDAVTRKRQQMLHTGLIARVAAWSAYSAYKKTERETLSTGYR
ncbi:hypothetical protein BJ166DRAFT_526752 [Pestalotiopsis sp. NC0098]|nr:hypothetical protein BJ166DRAFT_526752 [Pestalotiopsis sp. NC0098]